MLFMLPKGKQKTKNSASSVLSYPSSCFRNYKPTTLTIEAAHTLTTVQATLIELSSKNSFTDFNRARRASFEVLFASFEQYQ